MAELRYYRRIIQVSLLISSVSLVFNGYLKAQDFTVPGEITTPYPTIQNLAVEWKISGDDNLNGVVKVHFRKKGTAEWREGMNLRRVPKGANLGFSWENKHSGSIFDLEPDTEYEIKLSMSDPDGGADERTVSGRTRPVPEINGNSRIIELEPGLHDTLLTESGSHDRPVVYRCSQGTAVYKFIDVTGCSWVFIEGLTVKNNEPEGIAIRMNGAANCVVRHCKIESVWGIVGYKPGIVNCCISDNVVKGVNVWEDSSMGAHGNNIGEGIEITGPGNVICYNKVTGFRDCISTMEDEHAVNQTCIDIYNNDIYSGLDDGIEADFCFSNCRIMRNRLTNCYVGLSSQPGLGGPTYFIRNAMYNIIHAAYKLKRFSQGDVVLHNTVIKIGAGMGGNSKMDYAFFRNNLAFGGPDYGINWGGFGAGKPSAADIASPGDHSSFDYDAVGVCGTEYRATIGQKPFSMVEKHGIERLSIEETFNNVPFPGFPIPEKAVQDLRLKPGSKVVDAGVRIPNVNDNFNGKAPDIGAYELGQEMVHYGPR